jgi:branched-chain amino acid transport system permease protein
MASIAVSVLVFGSLYALLAAGLALVWGTLGVFNFAHGALLMVGAFLGWYLVSQLGLSILLSVPLSAVGVGGLGWVVYRAGIKPFMRREGAEWVVILSTLVIATLLEDGTQALVGGNDRPVAQLFAGNLAFGPVAVNWQEVIVIFAGPALLGGLVWFLKAGKLGFAIRAVAQNLDAAQLVGIPVDRVYATTFVLGAALAGVAGVLYGGEFGFNPTMGENLLLVVFVVVIIGGLASLRGTIMGAYVVALISTVSAYFLGLFWGPAFLYGTLILVLVFRPQGLLVGRSST